MTSAIELLRQGRRDEIWRKYCGFIDLSLEEFMEIQRRLLMEQIGLLARCELGRKIMGDKVPASVDEFREIVPLTTYQDYVPYLTEKREDVLPEKPYVWARTSGRSGEYECKWVPYVRELYTRVNSCVLAMCIFGSSDKRGDFVLEEGDVMLATLAPAPYSSGAVVAHGILEQFPFRYIPPLEKAEGMEFQERIEEGFKLALKEGIDIFYGLSSVLAKVGEQFEQRSGGVEISSLLHPKAILRLAKGLVKSKLAGRPMLPGDLWPVKAIVCGGTDTAILRDRIERYWGRSPVEALAITEAGIISMQTWGTGLTFVPDSGFLEFIPEEEHIKSRQDPDYQPRVLLLDEVTVGDVYEIVVTNFYGGPFVRYRVGDLIRITVLRDEEHNIDIPQMAFHSRADDVIDLVGFVRLTESTISWALENAKVSYTDWTTTKEVREERPVLHLYIELKEDELRGEEEIAKTVHQALKDLDPEYRDLDEMLGWKPPHVTFLSPGTFQRYTLEKQAAGADLAHLKPVRMRPSDKIMSDLLRLSAEGRIE